MPLAARLLCWGDLGRYEANSYGLPTLSEYFKNHCYYVVCVCVSVFSGADGNERLLAPKQIDIRYE